MKTLFFAIAMFAALQPSLAQKNNPYDNFGNQVMESIRFLGEEIDAGNIKDYSTETIEKYSGLLPFENKVSVEMVAEVYKKLHTPKLSMEELMEPLNLSDATREHFQEIFSTSLNKTAPEFRDYLSEKSEQLKHENLNDDESRMLLKYCTMSYHTSYITENPDAGGITSKRDKDQAALWGICGGLIGAFFFGDPGYGVGFVIGWTIGWFFGPSK